MDDGRRGRVTDSVNAAPCHHEWMRRNRNFLIGGMAIAELSLLLLARCSPRGCDRMPGEAASASSTLSLMDDPARPAKCAALDRDIATAFRSRDCKLDGDCVMHSTECACDRPVARSAVARIDELASRWNALACAYVGAPRACPSCVMPGTPVCKSGRCEEAQ